MSELGEALADLSAGLGALGVEWYVFGAQAVAARAAARATVDVDVTVRIERSRVGALDAELGSRGFTHRFPEARERLLSAGAVIPLRHRGGLDVDIVLAGSGLEALAFTRCTTLALDGVGVPVASATDLDLLRQLEEALGQSDLVAAFRALQRGS